MVRILEPSNSFREAAVDEVGLLIDARDYYRAFCRAALVAERYILLSGWQFDSGVVLLRGEDAEDVETPLELLPFLEYLCKQKPDLEIWILAWDFALVFAAEREWMQRLMFDWTTSERLRFRFDDNHAQRGCHHQKFAVIDGGLCFLGGLDLCEDRWDDRAHRADNPLRVSRGEPRKPFHDIQAFARGRALGAALEELFLARWLRTCGEPITLPKLVEPAAARQRIDGACPLCAPSAALSRTDPYGSPGGPEPCLEIQALHLQAIRAAERLIYLETQYMSSHTITKALEARMRASKRPKLEIVLILNIRGETLKEQAAVGLAQAQNIDRLRKVAAETGHALGMYYTLPACDAPETPARSTYIHAKLLIVDDRFLTVGSANLTNRSMVLDTELNLSVETADTDDALARSIRAIRRSLVAEHTGGAQTDKIEGLVAELDAIAARGDEGAREQPCRLRLHPSPTESEQTALALIDPQTLPFDPDQIEELSDEDTIDFIGGLGRRVRELFSSRHDRG
jgi:phosphatidylserine/phosphatidylglycerophosphate/cardiolipin synthase-like enzyme